jgi:ubiquinone/menaquinone biosynthesis C-methylase UbiE
MPHIFDPARLARLMSDERRRELPPDRILIRAGLTTGQTLVDIGCGPGFFALPAARIVGPRGRVVGLDISPVMIAELRRNASAAGLANVRAVRIAASSPEIPSGADLYLIVNTLHEFDDPAAHLAVVRKAMTASARLLIIDFLKKKKRMSGPPRADRIPLTRIKPLLRSSGLEFIRSFRANQDEYAVIACGDRA